MLRLLSAISILLWLSCAATSNTTLHNPEKSGQKYNDQELPVGPCVSFEQSDIGSLDISPYVKVVQNKVLMNWVLPEAFEVKYSKDAAWASICFVVNKDGSITDLRVSHSSKNKEFDKIAYNALRKSSPLPPLPPEVTLPRITGTFRFYLNLPIPE
jgi:TonB family protein